MKNQLLATFMLSVSLLAQPLVSYAGYEEGLTAYHKEDFQTAFKEFKLSAHQGVAQAQFNLGVMYVNGQGVAQDNEEAVKWFRKAADQGHASAQNNLGFMYANGRGVAQDYAQAVYWYRKAADQGHAEAQNNLGVMYDNGQIARQLSPTVLDSTNTYINPNVGTTIGDKALIEADNIVRQREAMGLAPVGQAGITDYLAQGVNQLSNIPRALGATLTGDAFGLETSYEDKIARDRKLSSFDTTREDQLQAEVAEASAKAKQAWDQGNKFDAAVSYLAGVGKAGVNNPLAVGGMALREAPTLVAQAASMLNPVTGAAMIGGTLNDLARQKYGEARDAQIAAEGGYRPLTSSEQTSLAMSVMPIAILKTALTALFGWLMLISARSLIRKLRSTKE